MEMDFGTLNGRDSELQFISECMIGVEPRSVVVAGPAGVGKTGLVREVLAAVECNGRAMRYVHRETARVAALPACVVSEAATTFPARPARCSSRRDRDGGAAMPMATATGSCIPTSATGSVADLLRRASNGDSAAWEQAVRRYSKLVSATVRTFRLQDADARDAVQMTWLRLAENAHRVQWSERLAGWLATTARRECLRILRRAKRAPDLCDTVADTIVDPSVNPEQRVIEADVARALWNLVDELPSRQRILLRALFSDDPPPYAEVARTAGIPPGAIGPTRARALQQLRSRLEEHGLGPAAWR